MKKLPREITLECNVVRGKAGWSLTVIDSGQEFFVPAPPKNGHIDEAALNAVIEHIKSLPKQENDLDEILSMPLTSHPGDGSDGVEVDFLDEIIQERTEKNPEFQELVDKASDDNYAQVLSTLAESTAVVAPEGAGFELNTADMSDLIAAAGAKRPTIAPPPPLSATDHPNSYTVDLNVAADKVVALWSKAQEPEKYDVVRPVGTNRFTVLIHAANSKHAQVVGEHLIRKHMKRG